MAILENVLIGPNQKEQVDPKKEGLLYRIDEVIFKKFLMENVPWHWHPFLEFAFQNNHRDQRGVRVQLCQLLFQSFFEEYGIYAKSIPKERGRKQRKVRIIVIDGAGPILQEIGSNIVLWKRLILYDYSIR